MSQHQVWSVSKHTDFLCDGMSSLEGQSVRAADKISYLLSDIEDGIKIGAVSLNDLLSCKLFHRPPIDLRLREGDSLLAKFLEQRGAIIKLLMEDLILESSKRISKLSSPKEVKRQSDYSIYHSQKISSDMDEVWKKIQSNRLHRDPRVLAANMKASKMVSELTVLFTLIPDMVPSEFRIEHDRLRESKYIEFYKSIRNIFDIQKKFLSFMPVDLMIGFNGSSCKNIEAYNLILAKDYVASLSDKEAVKLHEQLISGVR